jgi:DNA replication protein DnaC
LNTTTESNRRPFSIERMAAEHVEAMKDPEYARRVAAEEEAAKAEKAAKAEADRIEWADGSLRRSTIRRALTPRDIAMVTGEAHDATPAMKLCSQWFDEWLKGDERDERWRPWLWVGGGRGIGKTLAAATLIRRCALTYPRGRVSYVRMSDLIRIQRARDSFKTKDVDEADEMMGEIVESAFVVLDEIGQEPETHRELARQAFADFVEARRSHGGPTLVLSNKSAATIRERFRSDWYDPRTESRLSEILVRDANGKGLHDLGGTDLRGEPI